MLSPKRDLIAAKLFLWLALSGGGPRPRVINVDGHPAYASAIAELKQTGELGRRCRCRTTPYLNNVIEHSANHVALTWNQMLTKRLALAASAPSLCADKRAECADSRSRIRGRDDRREMP